MLWVHEGDSDEHCLVMSCPHLGRGSVMCGCIFGMGDDIWGAFSQGRAEWDVHGR